MYPSFGPGRPQLAGEQNQAKQPISLSKDNADVVSLEAAVFTMQSSPPAIEKDTSIDLSIIPPATSSKRPVLFNIQKLWSTFSIIKSLSQEKKPGKRHRRCGLEKKETDDANVLRYSDDFGFDATMDNDWLMISGVHLDFKDEYSLQQAAPADDGAPLEQDLLYQAALAAAVQKAAAAGKFDHNTSLKVPAKLTIDSPKSLQSSKINDTLNEYDPNTYDADFDNNVIAEANASALANDSDGFYIQEFGLLCLEYEL